MSNNVVFVLKEIVVGLGEQASKRMTAMELLASTDGKVVHRRVEERHLTCIKVCANTGRMISYVHSEIP